MRSKKEAVASGREEPGKMIKMCGDGGCKYKTGYSLSLKYHKACKHSIKGRNVRKLCDNGKERDYLDQIVKMCGVGGCEYKRGHPTHMKDHKAAEHGIRKKRVRKIPEDGNESG